MHSNFGHKNPSSIETYIKLGGYTAWKKILAEKTSKSEIINTIKESLNLKVKAELDFLLD